MAYLVAVTQVAADVELEVRYPDGSTTSFASPLRRDEREFVLLEPKIAGEFRLEIRKIGAAPSIPLPSVTPLLDSTDLELRAWRLITDASAKYASGKFDAQVLLAIYQEAAEIWGELGRVREKAYSTYCAGMVAYWYLNDWQRASEFGSSSAADYADLGLVDLQASGQYLQAVSLIEVAGERSANAADPIFERTFELLEAAGETFRKLDRRYEAARVINDRGLVHYYRGNLESAGADWEMAAAEFRAIDELTAELQSLQNLAVIDIERGYNQSAIRSLGYILEQLPENADPSYRAFVLDNLGIAHGRAGDMDEALQAISASYDIYVESGDRLHQGRALSGIGTTYYYFGELDLASDYLRQAQAVSEEVGDRRTLAAIEKTLGDIAFEYSDYEAALASHRRAVELTRSDVDRAFRLLLTARDLNEMGRSAEAKEVALVVRSLIGDLSAPVMEADVDLELGKSLISEGEVATGSEKLLAALSGYESLRLEGRQAEARRQLGLVALQEGHYADAVAQVETALTLTEGLRARVAPAELRAFFLSTRRSYYDTLVKILLRWSSENPEGGFLEAALSANERGRARMTMDLLAQASIDIESTVDPGLEAKKRDLLDDLEVLKGQRDILGGSGASAAAGQERDRLDFQLGLVENQLNLVEIQLRNSSPRYADLTEPRTLSASEIQNSLDAETVVLQYQLGRAGSFVWIVDRDRIQGVALPDSGTIERLAREVLTGLRSRTSGRQHRLDTEKRLRDLSRMVLVPVASHLRSRVLIAADGVLRYIPFSVLPVGEQPFQPLVAEQEVVVVPSISVLAAQRARRVEMPLKTIAIVADPVFEADDARVATPQTGSSSDLPVASDGQARSADSQRFVRLPATALEARAIADLVPEEDAWMAMGFEANRDTVITHDLSRYRILHFATHGRIDSRYPALSALILSQFDRNGTPRNGYLRLNDIYQLDLNADLVVLSACETALGRDIRGEGLIGLTQGFMYAGARALVVSLWQVPDRATAELMGHFYDLVLNGGVTPAKALADAQMAIASRQLWQDPYYWGAFVLVGLAS